MIDLINLKICLCAGTVVKNRINRDYFTGVVHLYRKSEVENLHISSTAGMHLVAKHQFTQADWSKSLNGFTRMSFCLYNDQINHSGAEAKKATVHYSTYETYICVFIAITCSNLNSKIRNVYNESNFKNRFTSALFRNI